MTFATRAMKRVAAVAVASIAAAALLAGCSSTGGSGNGSGGVKQLTFQTSWVPSVQFSGSYLADSEGYYKKEGLAVKFLPGGPDVDPLAVVAAGKADIGLSNADFVARANAQGAGLVMIAAGFQQDPFTILSSPDKPLKKPQDMIGKKIGVPSADDALWQAFLKINKIDASKVTEVPVGFDVAPLVSGEVDGLLSFYTEQPTSYKEATGKEGVNMLVGDYGLNVYAQVYAVRKDDLADAAKRKEIEAFMKAELKGWNDYVKDPQKAVDITVNDYAKDGGLNAAQQLAQAKLQLDLLVTPETKKNGLLWISQDGIKQNLKTFDALGIKGATKSIFDTSIQSKLAG
jgi:ABC-type nitrate/sulfonate/bicarbonate transport system substrate-binding protein